MYSYFIVPLAEYLTQANIHIYSFVQVFGNVQDLHITVSSPQFRCANKTTYFTSPISLLINPNWLPIAGVSY
jgi:hypothetical protein